MIEEKSSGDEGAPNPLKDRNTSEAPICVEPRDSTPAQIRLACQLMVPVTERYCNALDIYLGLRANDVGSIYSVVSFSPHCECHIFFRRGKRHVTIFPLTELSEFHSDR